MGLLTMRLLYLVCLENLRYLAGAAACESGSYKQLTSENWKYSGCVVGRSTRVNGKIEYVKGPQKGMIKEGVLKKDLLNGYGTKTWPSGIVETGQFKNGKKNGIVKQTF